MIEFLIAEHIIMLEFVPGVFQPTTTTQLLAKYMGNVEGKVVLDLGCGSGPIAIAAALNRAKKVYAVDIMTQACENTMQNAKINGVLDKIEIICGNLFEPLKDQKFDVIINDVSGMAEEVSRISPWYPETIPTGGVDGTFFTILMLHASPNYLNRNGYLIFPVISLSRSAKTISTAMEVYGKKLNKIEDRYIPFCKELLVNLEILEKLSDEGIIYYVQKRSRYFWKLEIYKASA